MSGADGIRQRNLEAKETRSPHSMHWLLRGTCLITGILVAALLAIAYRLDPAPEGRGTHQQLGLPPCIFVSAWGIPCPSCGMTTSWSCFVRGNISASIRANAGGTLLAIIALAYLPASWYFFLGGVATRRGWFSFALAFALTSAMIVSTAQWIARLISD